MYMEKEELNTEVAQVMLDLNAKESKLEPNLYELEQDGQTVLLSYVAESPMLVISIYDPTNQIQVFNLSVLNKLNSNNILGSHAVRDGFYIFRHCMWLDVFTPPLIDAVRKVIALSVNEANKGQKMLRKNIKPIKNISFS